LYVQLSKLTVSCYEPGAEVRLDGKLLFTGPGKRTLYVQPEEHQIVATKPGFLTFLNTLAATPGSPMTLDVRLVALTSATTVAWQWPRWRPIVLVVAGGAVAGVGGMIYYTSAKIFWEIGRQCPRVCNSATVAATPALASKQQRVEDLEDISFGM